MKIKTDKTKENREGEKDVLKETVHSTRRIYL